MSRLNNRGVSEPLLFGLVATVIILAIVFLLVPAFFLALVLIFAGLFVLVQFKAHPWGLGIGTVLIILGFVLGVIAQGQQLSLVLVHL